MRVGTVRAAIRRSMGVRAFGGSTAFVAVLCACVAGIQANQCEPFEIGIHLDVERSIASKVMTAVLEDEAAGIWRPYGVQLEWTDARAAEAGANRFSLEVMLKSSIDGPGRPRGATVLGWTFVRLDAPGSQPIHVSFDATESVLDTRKTGGASLVQIVHEHEMARALGRVLAHEIGHVVLGAPYHDDAGLMRAVFRPDELAAPDRAPFRLTCTGVGRLRSRLRLLTVDPRFARRRGSTAPDDLEGSDGIERKELDQAQCITGRTAP